MNSGTRILVKVLAAVVSYGIAFALAIYAINQMTGQMGGSGEISTLAWVILVILAIFGYRAIKHLPFLIFSGGPSGQGFCYTLIMIFLRVLLSVFAGVFIAPWVIAKKLASLIPGEKTESSAEE